MIRQEMKVIGLVLILSVMSLTTFGQSNKLEVIVTGVKDATGVVTVALFDKEENFLEDTKYKKTIKAVGEKVIAVFDNLPVGEYAIGVIHDANENGDLDSNFMGIPKEGFGFGNDAMGMFGPPSYEKAKIKWDGTTGSVQVELKYY